MVQGLGFKVKWAQAFFRLPRTSVRVTRLALNKASNIPVPMGFHLANMTLGRTRILFT